MGTPGLIIQGFNGKVTEDRREVTYTLPFLGLRQIRTGPHSSAPVSPEIRSKAFELCVGFPFWHLSDYYSGKKAVWSYLFIWLFLYKWTKRKW